MKFLKNGLLPVLLALFPGWVNASGGGYEVLGATEDPLAYLCIAIFVLAYIMVMGEEVLHLRKSKPVILAAGIIWALIATIAHDYGVEHEALRVAVLHNLGEYSALFLFLLVAMTFINTMEERLVFDALRARLMQMGLSFRQLFWVTGTLAFFISPVADNLTTALLMGAVIMSVGGDSKRFVTLAMINVVVAANAGGAFSPFGDITTLMVWQAGKVEFFGFFALFLPAVVNYLVPALIMTVFVPTEKPSAINERVHIKPGGLVVCGLFMVTIILAVTFEKVFSLPPFMGMMTGMSLLMFYTWYLTFRSQKMAPNHQLDESEKGELDIFLKVAKAEWDTLLFFFGIIFAVGGLGYLGYLEMISSSMYAELGASVTNIVAGLVSAVVDNIPVMFAIISMDPEMGNFQWLLITLTAGVGGSLLSVGSAAGVALMGTSKGTYTFMGHLRWSWAIALGYAASVGVHFLLNS
ncbi:sodium:proton antiporter NhaD [Kistimonas asteriae]|uniref:sodium:proton antiporter NhaD n=1 Tax=Kistimonas asteriae TaxID=517724 RepID=UPI001BAA7B8B|nr:sodium:proton antiporter NhaD [Kistimonas asteriae]